MESKENKEHLTSEWKGKKGEWKFVHNKSEQFISIKSDVFDNEDETICGIYSVVGKDVEQCFANAELICDAGNTIQKCNVMPSKMYDLFIDASTKNDLDAEKIINLQKQRDELLDQIEKFFIHGLNDFQIRKAKELINKTEDWYLTEKEIEKSNN